MSKNVVFIPCVEIDDRHYIKDRSKPYKYGIASWKKWCDKNDCELFLLKDLITDHEYMKVTWQRYYVLDLLENQGIDYDQVLMIDADSIIHPDCPNFFEMTDRKYCGVHANGSYDWVCRSIENYSKHLFDGKIIPFWEYIMGGWQVFNKDHKQFHQDIIKFYFENRDKILKLQEYFVGTDQPVINFLKYKHDIDFKILPYEFSMADMARKEVLDEDLTMTKVGWIYQYNAIPDNKNADKTYYWMKKTYEHLYGKLDEDK
tara:strand:+ start:8711 stop:9487 length:777 start_codon:yes stop_codon:yes gene_type:complete